MLFTSPATVPSVYTRPKFCSVADWAVVPVPTVYVTVSPMKQGS